MLAIVFIVLSCTVNDRVREEVSEASTYSNPVIPGEIPDPSIVRVGQTYYAVGTSFDFAPNYPIYESIDLINWAQIGAVFSEPPAWSSDDFWAPELYYDEGTFYVYYTAKRKSDRVACIGVATTKDIRKGFDDHGIIVSWGDEAIDAFVFKDDDGKRYITWKAYGLTEGRPVEILGSELSADGLSLTGDHFTLTYHAEGWRAGGDEGQCIVRHDNYYYMLYSDGGCCDNKCDYRIVVSRSKDLRSGWEQLPDPILAGGEAWRCPGHGTLVTTPDGRYFYLYHAYHATDFEYVGRQGMLDELAWDDESGWPYMKHGKNPTVSSPTPFANTVQARKSVHEDYFASNDELDLREWDLLFPRPEARLKNGTVSIIPSHGGTNFLGFRPEAGNYSFQSRVGIAETTSGIGIYANQQKLLVIALRDDKIIIYKVEDAIEDILAAQAINGDEVYLKYTVTDGKHIEYYWSAGGTDWKPIEIDGKKSYDATFLATWGFSPRAGLMVEGGKGGNFARTRVQYLFR